MECRVRGNESVNKKSESFAERIGVDVENDYFCG